MVAARLFIIRLVVSLVASCAVKPVPGLFRRRADSDIYPGFPGSREFEWEYAVSGLDAINPAYF